MSSNLLAFIQAKELRKQALKNAQLAHLQSKKYRGVAYKKAPATSPVAGNLTYRGIQYNK